MAASIFRDDSYLKDEDFLLKKLAALDLSCSSCAEDFGQGDEVVLVKIVRGQQVRDPAVPSGLRKEAYDEIDDQGDYRFDPYFMHFECWELIAEEHSESIADLPPIWDDDTQALTFCCFCRNSIRAWEVFGLVLFGEVDASLRSPNGEHGNIKFRLVDDSEPQEVCLSCLRKISDDTLELWDNLSDHGECADCTHLRCWRTDYNPCKCPCAHEET